MQYAMENEGRIISSPASKQGGLDVWVGGDHHNILNWTLLHWEVPSESRGHNPPSNPHQNTPLY